MTVSGIRGDSGGRRRFPVSGIIAAGAAALIALASCSKQSPPRKPLIHKTKAFDDVFGEVPPLPVAGPGNAAVVYFPSAASPEQFRPVPVFIVEQGKEEALAVRTAIRGIETGEGPADAIMEEIAYPFPTGSDLLSIDHEGGIARIRIGGAFRAAALSRAEGETAAKSLALTVAQFGKSGEVDLTDEAGDVHFGAKAEDTRVADPGPPILLGLMAIREEEGQPPGVLSVLFDRPVFVEGISWYPPGGQSPYPGKVYSTGFGMTAELHPEPAVSFDGGVAYRVRYTVRDGKGRRTSGDAKWVPDVVTRH